MTCRSLFWASKSGSNRTKFSLQLKRNPAMAAIAEPAIEAVNDRLAARNALVLAVAQALAGANVSVIVATGGIAGATLAPDPALATLPISVMIVGMWLGTMPVGMLAQAFGRRFALQTGSVFGAVSG